MDHGFYIIPRRSMYAIYAYIGGGLWGNVGIYGIHAVSWSVWDRKDGSAILYPRHDLSGTARADCSPRQTPQTDPTPVGRGSPAVVSIMFIPFGHPQVERHRRASSRPTNERNGGSPHRTSSARLLKRPGHHRFGLRRLGGTLELHEAPHRARLDLGCSHVKRLVFGGRAEVGEPSGSNNH